MPKRKASNFPPCFCLLHHVFVIIVVHIIKKNIASHWAYQFFGVHLEQAAWTNCLKIQNCNETSGLPLAAASGRFLFATDDAIQNKTDFWPQAAAEGRVLCTEAFRPSAHERLESQRGFHRWNETFWFNPLAYQFFKHGAPINTNFVHLYFIYANYFLLTSIHTPVLL